MTKIGACLDAAWNDILRVVGRGHAGRQQHAFVLHHDQNICADCRVTGSAGDRVAADQEVGRPAVVAALDLAHLLERPHRVAAPHEVVRKAGQPGGRVSNVALPSSIPA